MAGTENVARLRRLIDEGFSRGDLGVVDELMDPDCVEHQRGNRPGAAGAKEVIETLHRWMSDFSLVVEDVAVAGDIVWSRNRARGTNTGSVMGHPPNGKPVDVDVIDIVRFEGGRIVEHWGIADQLGLMLQVGVGPPGDRGRKP